MKILLENFFKTLVLFRIMNKRKRIDSEQISNKKKNIMIKNDSDDECSILSPRISPINRPSLSIGFFQCQICQRYFKVKDIYLDHLTFCAKQNQVSIKIIRAIKDNDEQMN